VSFEPAPFTRYLDFWVFSEFYDLSQELTIVSGGRATRLPLTKAWAPASVEIPAGADAAAFAVNKILPASHHPGDPRDLAVRLRDLRLHGDRQRHDQVRQRQANLVANTRDMLGGRPAPESTPPNLGIDMYGVCNVKPPCVYCAWDDAKTAEGEFVDAPFTTGTLREWGPLFENSTNLVNCSIGEPFMMKNIDELLDAFADGGKLLEMTTNGQILTDTNIGKLLGRPVNLYISLDAATPGTYATLRNHRFDVLVGNVRRLIDAKGGPGRLPVVNLVFMPMRANVQELDEFVALCADLRADYLVLRPLNYAEKVELNWDRAGYRFEYDKELLGWEELVRTSGRAAELCRRAGVTLSDQMDFGGSFGEQFAALFEAGRRSVAGEPAVAVQTDSVSVPSPAPPTLGAERLPICTEPWKSLYILRRGVFPCCYGGQPLAPMDKYREAWDSPELQAIRRDLAHGRFHQYCLDSPACPVVRKSLASGTMESRLSARKRARAGLERRWRAVVWARQWAGIRMRRILKERGYVRHHIGRLSRRLRGK
jgi:MoaA/NifB/PqqE/SkfB family radical SAM enzyme